MKFNDTKISTTFNIFSFSVYLAAQYTHVILYYEKNHEMFLSEAVEVAKFSTIDF